MVLTLTDNEYSMLQILASKGLDSMKLKLNTYSDFSIPACFRNRCSEEMKNYENLAARLNCTMGDYSR